MMVIYKFSVYLFYTKFLRSFTHMWVFQLTPDQPVFIGQVDSLNLMLGQDDSNVNPRKMIHEFN